MPQPETSQFRKPLIIAAVLIAGEVMPYLSRIPRSFVHGMPWIWGYMTSFDDVLRWNIGQAVTLAPLGLFCLIYVFANRKFPLIVATLTHFSITCVLYEAHGDPPNGEDFLGSFVYPFMIALPAGVAGMAALLGQSAVEYIQRRRAAKNILAM